MESTGMLQSITFILFLTHVYAVVPSPPKPALPRGILLKIDAREIDVCYLYTHDAFLEFNPSRLFIMRKLRPDFTYLTCRIAKAEYNNG